MVAVPVVTLSGELVQTTYASFRAEVEPLLSARGPGLVLDLAAVPYASSVGLGWFVHVGKTLADQGRALALARVTRTLERTLRVIGLDDVIPLFRTVAEAQAWVAARGAHEL